MENRSDGLTEAQVEEFERRVQARAEANAVALPGPLLEAFAGQPVKACGFGFRPMVGYDWVMLQALGSVIGIPDPEERAKMKVSPDDVYEAAFLFTRPLPESRALLRKGREVFREEALHVIADGLVWGQEAELEAAVIETVRRAVDTFVAYQARGPEDGTVFTKPPAGPMTGSAGGSI